LTMRLSHVVPSIDPRFGGPSVSVPNLATALAHAGHEVSLFATEAASSVPPTLPSVAYRHAPTRGSATLANSPELFRLLRQTPADLIHAHALWQRPLHYAHQCASQAGVPLVISPRGMMSPWAWRHRRWKKWLAEKFVHPGAFAAAAGWHATSQDEADDIRARGWRQPICVAPNGVAIPDERALAEARAYWHHACPDCASRPTALFHSRLHEKKRVVEVVDLWMDTASPDWLLLIVGIPETITVAQLRDRVAARGGTARVAVFDGTQTPPPYAAARLFLLPSHTENFGMVIAEALACGVPALVTDTTPWHALNRNGCGWCCPWSDYRDRLRLALATSCDELAERGHTARRWMQTDYSWAQTAATLSAFYSQLLATR